MNLGRVRLATLALLAAVSLALAVTDWKAPPEEAARENPVPASPEALARGKAVYADLCLPCHGTDGSGDADMEAALQADVGDLSPSGDLEKRTDGELHWWIENGSDLMPAFEGAVDDESLWELIHYVRVLGEGEPPAER
jgi:putative copper resistance protein D